ncbi:conserved hypothetical protein [Burkholderia sp. 8Y]|uniref:hypothetical protein n=1 Tax=Burkholderia sp. 8Y TaxID=2653133 RepID=UPI0012F2F858|nr:hypothetical protein [Burkholderia sp. 8Y]VXC86470.1 conserved hypothetical protein [Burkholderia sp. 8Y]
MAVSTVDKGRHEVMHAGHLWEIDESEGANAPLVVAEIKLKAVDELFEMPEWVGDEVSENSAYTNSLLGLKPFLQW